MHGAAAAVPHLQDVPQQVLVRVQQVFQLDAQLVKQVLEGAGGIGGEGGCGEYNLTCKRRGEGVHAWAVGQARAVS